MSVFVSIKLDLDKVRQLKVDAINEINIANLSPRPVELLSQVVTLLGELQQAALDQGIPDAQVYGAQAEEVE